MSVLTPLGKIGLTPRGPYDEQTDYARLDVVLLSGSSYVCIDPSRGESPDQSAKWRLLAAGGEGSGGSGTPGPAGPAGEDGATFTPSVDEEGNLSWTNDKELPNPPTVNIKGKDGKDGKDGTGASVTLSDADPMPLAAQASAGDSNEVSRANHVHKLPTAEEIGARPSTWTPTAEEIGAKPSSYEPDLSGYVPTTRTINGQPLSLDVNLTAESVGAKPAGYEPDLSGYVPVGRTINGKPLSTDVFLGASDVGALSSGLPVSVAQGGTGAGDAATARTNLGIRYQKISTTIQGGESPCVRINPQLYGLDLNSQFVLFLVEVKTTYSNGNLFLPTTVDNESLTEITITPGGSGFSVGTPCTLHILAIG